MTHCSLLNELCDLPTAPYAEEHVIAWLRDWAGRHRESIRSRQDAAGNLYLEYDGRPRGRIRSAKRPPLVLEAHMDHPGFLVEKQRRDGRIDALFRGGVKPSHFKDAQVRFWSAGEWVKSRVLTVKTLAGKRPLKVLLAAPEGRARLAPGALGMWDLPDAAARRGLFAARVCDDLAGVAAMIGALEELLIQKVPAHVVALCSRAEEVGFAGVLAICEHGWIPRGSPVIGLETSKASAGAPQGGGPIIRVGDRTGIFSAGLTHFIAQAAGHLSDDDATFKYQRKLMDGGMCNSTAFAAYGYDAAGLCLALGNYHNMFDRAAVGPYAPFRAPVAKAGPGIASETIHLGDFDGLVRLLVEVARRIGDYEPGLAVVRRRLAKMHREEQRKLLYGTRKRNT